MTNILAWIGTLTSIAGSFLVAMTYFQAGYVLFSAGSLSWLIVALVRRDRALGVLNLAFFTANMIGIYNFFG
jgi:hypothetical protein